MKKRNAWLLALGAAIGGTGVYGWKAHAPAAPAEPPPAVAAQRAEEPRGRRVALGVPAESKLVEATARIERRWSEKNHAAIEALEKGDLARAIELFGECHAAVPDEPVFAGNLAEALARLSVVEYERGGKQDREQSLEHLKRAIALAPERADLEQRRAQLERLLASEKDFWTDASEHFELSYDGDRDDLLMSAYEITSLLESAYQQLGELFGAWPVEDGRPKIRVVLYRREGFHDATGIGHWAGGLYDGSIRVPLENLGQEKAELERVLRHEITHAFVAVVGGPDVPGWLNEGLAQRLESGDLLRRARDVQAARKRLAGKTLLPLAELHKSLGMREDQSEIGLAYAQALALTEHVERVYGERVLFDMVAGARASVAVANTFEKRTGVALDVALSDLAQEL